MPDRLPSLTGLRAFDAAARRLSFKDAAAELNVTPAALSFQIKGLEEDLGAPLFDRRPRAVELTERGKVLAPHVRDAFAALRAGWNEARRADDENRLTVTCGPAFAAKWLAPALGRFARAHPDIELRFVATLARLDIGRDGIDLAVRFGAGDDPGFFRERLMGDYVFPVMRPDIAARVSTPADLLRETLITDESILFLDPPPDWAHWLAAAGVVFDRLPKGLSFSQADHAVDAAQDGAGVVLGRSSMMRQALRSGELVAPFDLVLTTPAEYRIVCPQGRENHPATRAFRAFLKAEAATDDGLPGAPRIVLLAPGAS